MSIKNWDWAKEKMSNDDMLRNMLAFQWSFGVTRNDELGFCDNKSAIYCTGSSEEHTFPTKEREEVLKDHFCENCIFAKECKDPNRTSKDLAEAKIFWLIGNHHGPKAKLLRSFKFPSGQTIPKGRIVEVISEQKSDLQLKLEDGTIEPAEFYYTIKFENECFSVTKRDLEFKEEKVI